VIIEAGTWNLEPKRRDLGQRLEWLSLQVRDILQRYNPARVGLEKAVYFKNVASSFVLSEARGVCRLLIYEVLDQAADRLIELSPTQVKKAAVGFGGANKEQLAAFLMKRFRMDFEQSRRMGPDTFDAIAVAWATSLVLAKERRFLRSQGEHFKNGNKSRALDQG
jgi:crossover junction endodeoxyribonuclease RuvC